MGNNNNHNHQFNSELDNSLNCLDNDEWGSQEDLIYAKKKHQSHRGRNKCQVRRDIESIKERKHLSTMLGDYFDANLDLF